jgi:hypothetical protein
LGIRGREGVPVVFGSLDEIVDLGIHELEDPLFGCFLVVLEFFGCVEDDGSAC